MKWRTALALAVVVAIAGLAATLGRAPSEADDAPDRERLAASDVLRGPLVPTAGALPGRLELIELRRCRYVTLDYATLELSYERVDSAVGNCDAGAPLPEHVDAKVSLAPSDLESGLRSRSAQPLRVLGADRAAGGLLAVAVQRDGARRTARTRAARAARTSAERFASSIRASHGGSLPERVLQLWSGGELVSITQLPTLEYLADERLLGELVEFSPSGDEVAVAAPGFAGRAVVLDVDTASVALGPLKQRSLSWSPDGRWLAVAIHDAVAIYGPLRAEPIYVLPIDATGLAWSE